MKNTLFRRLSIISTICFIFLVMYVALLARGLEKAILETEVVNMTDMLTIKPVLGSFFLAMGFMIGLGLLSIIFLLAADRSKGGQEQIIIQQFAGKAAGESQDTAHGGTHGASEEELGFESMSTWLQSNAELPFEEKSSQILAKICNELSASQGAIFLASQGSDIRYIELASTYAYSIPDTQTIKYEFGEGISGQVAKEGKSVNLSNVPEGYIEVLSGLGSSSPTALAVVPFFLESELVGVAEIASFHEFSPKTIQFLEDIFNKLGQSYSAAKGALN